MSDALDVGRIFPLTPRFRKCGSGAFREISYNLWFIGVFQFLLRRFGIAAPNDHKFGTRKWKMSVPSILSVRFFQTTLEKIAFSGEKRAQHKLYFCASPAYSKGSAQNSSGRRFFLATIRHHRLSVPFFGQYLL